MEYGRYRILKELGKGTMGVVYQAHDPQIDRMVALKILRPDRMVSESFVARFLKEARAIGRLSHPHIVTIYDVGEDHNTIYIAMEYLEGRPFNDVIRSGSLTAASAVEIARQVADALDYAHSKAIVHRDIKPSNIILSDDNKVKLTDFGIARIEDTATAHQTQAGEILGTPVYMAPEQVMGQTVDGRSDLFSLGVILYEMTVGRRPFSGNNIAAIFRSITQDNPETPESVDPFISKDLSRLIMKSLAKLPQERFQTGREMAKALDTLATDRKDEPQKPAERPKKNRLPVMIAALALLMVVAVSGVWFFGRKTPQHDAGQTATAQPSETGSQTIPQTQPAAVNTAEQPERLASLKISSEPVGAQVYIDSLFKGKTPLDIDLPLGKYEVRLNMPEYLEWEAQINLDTEGPTPLHIPLRSLN